MKITYIISNIATQSEGNGGHYYSLLVTAASVKRLHEVKIINIGTSESLALQSSDLEILNIIDRKLRNIKLIRYLCLAIKNDPPNVIHAFDYHAYFYARLISILYRIPVILTKCGGKDPRFYYPFCRNLINYSVENDSYFKSKRKYKKANLYLIPNRISPFKDDDIRIKKIKDKYNLENYDYIFLRIARIGPAYKKSIIQLGNLITEYKKSNINICLLIIGTLEDANTLEEIKNNISSDLFIENDPYFTKNSKEIISVADVVLGTGRSFMEAAIKHKIMLAPLKNHTFPALVTLNNFDELFKTNFSERGYIVNFNDQENIHNLYTLLTNKREKEIFIEKSSKLYEENFNIEKKLPLYDMIYSQIKFQRSLNFIDSFLNYLFILKVYLQQKRNTK